MKVTAPFDAFVPALADDSSGGLVAAGESVEVPDEVGASLLEQGWKGGTKRARSTDDETTPDTEDK